jgi:tRNA modification GTPase
MTAATIFAPASGPGPAGIAVIRVSGPQAAASLIRLTGSLPPARFAKLARIVDAAGALVDVALVLWFPRPASCTGEDVAEFHVHGGRAVVAGVLEALAEGDGMRLAEPGEFTRRAFHNGKLDLTAAEGLADLIAAETAAQRRQALRQMEGHLAVLCDGWRERLVRALARVEAEIDFSDQDLPSALAKGALADVAALRADLRRHLDDGRRGERLREGVVVALCGPPNAGKSSLLNVIARRDAAIVSPQPGTTRDVIEVRFNLDGFPLVVADTAGLRAAADAVEDEGVRRARRTAAAADLRLAVFDGEVWPAVDGETAAMIDDDALVVVNKCDLGRARPPLAVHGRPALAVSALTADGVPELLAALGREVAARFAGTAAPAITRLRHRQAFEACDEALGRAAAADALELVAEEMRLAANALGRVTGRIDVEAVLDAVFRDFCIGK